MRKKSKNNEGHDHRNAKMRAFEEAWCVLRQNCEYVVTYGFNGFHPKYRGLEDIRASQAFKNLEPYLSSLRKPRLVLPPEAAWWLSPIMVETAHEALLALFNPPEQLFGVQSFLSSTYFKELVRDARLELSQCLKQKPPTTPATDEEAKARAFKFNLAAALRTAHLVNGKLINKKPLSQRRIGEMIGASQAEISRDIKKYLGAGWMSVYKAALSRGDLTVAFEGFFRADGDVEAIDNEDADDSDDSDDSDDVDDITGGFECE